MFPQPLFAFYDCDILKSTAPFRTECFSFCMCLMAPHDSNLGVHSMTEVYPSPEAHDVHLPLNVDINFDHLVKVLQFIRILCPTPSHATNRLSGETLQTFHFLWTPLPAPTPWLYSWWLMPKPKFRMIVLQKSVFYIHHLFNILPVSIQHSISRALFPPSWAFIYIYVYVFYSTNIY